MPKFAQIFKKLISLRRKTCLSFVAEKLHFAPLRDLSECDGLVTARLREPCLWQTQRQPFGQHCNEIVADGSLLSLLQSKGIRNLSALPFSIGTPQVPPSDEQFKESTTRLHEGVTWILEHRQRSEGFTSKPQQWSWPSSRRRQQIRPAMPLGSYQLRRRRKD